MKSYLVLEDGNIFEGKQIGSDREAVCEIVFNTSMTGYLELLTDPSYAGQGVVSTYPLIGNYGICLEDVVSRRPWLDAFIVREMSKTPSNFRSEMTLNEYLVQHDITGIQGVDTRALTKILREKGTMRGMITTCVQPDVDAIVKRLKAHTTENLVKRVSIKDMQVLENDGKTVALMDFGATKGIADSLHQHGLRVVCFPAETKAEDILAIAPAGIVLSNGPGDPKSCDAIVAEIRKLYDSDLPIFGVGLGHQLMALATGAETVKLKHGHRGSNYPVRDTKTGKCYITSQNHGYVVLADSVNPEVGTVSFINVNDGTCEGILYEDKKIMTIQFLPGPCDTGFLFDSFINMMGGAR